jgi:biopolymer transport protein ExbD
MPLKTYADEEPALNLTPMIDVLFLLIIFFMAGTKFTELERKIGLTLPQVSDGRQLPPAPDRVVVNVYRDGSLTLEREPVSLQQLSQRLKEWRQRNPALSVNVRGDGEGALRNVTEVLATCKSAGVYDVGISVLVSRQTTGGSRQ